MVSQQVAERAAGRRCKWAGEDDVGKVDFMMDRKVLLQTAGSCCVVGWFIYLHGRETELLLTWWEINKLCYHKVIALFLKGKKDYVSEFDAREGIRENPWGAVLCAGKLGCVNDDVASSARGEIREMVGGLFTEWVSLVPFFCLFVLAKSELKFKRSDHENHCICLVIFLKK